MTSRCSPLAMAAGFVGEGDEADGMKRTISRPSASRAARARATWPACGGSKLPPSSPMRRRRSFVATMVMMAVMVVMLVQRARQQRAQRLGHGFDHRLGRRAGGQLGEQH